MFLNISNHPVAKWSPEQVAAAEALGNHVQDVPFPNVPPTATAEEVTAMARVVVAQFASMPVYGVDCVMVQGEFSLTYELSRMFLALGWEVVVATTERNVEEVDGKKVVTFQFVQFRKLRP